jgi:hypothetical protein
VSEYWEVRIEGDPACKHEIFERATLTSNPPISQVRCRTCGRMLWQRHELYRDSWPEFPLVALQSQEAGE